MFRTHRLSYVISLLALFATACDGADKETDETAETGETATELQPLTVTLVPGRSNAWLIEGEAEAILVDSTMFVEEAEAAVASITASGKTLNSVFLTHAHSDHISGSKVLMDAFPDADLLATSDVVADYNTSGQGGFAFLKSVYGDLLAEELAAPPTSVSTSLTLEGHTLEIIEVGAGEAAVSSMLYLPDSEELFAGDSVYVGYHMYTAECRISEWRSQLEGFKTAYPDLETIYPGHGGEGTLVNIDQNIDYLDTWVTTMEAASGDTDEDVIASAYAGITAAYPELASSEGVLDLTVVPYLTCIGKIDAGRSAPTKPHAH